MSKKKNVLLSTKGGMTFRQDLLKKRLDGKTDEEIRHSLCCSQEAIDNEEKDISFWQSFNLECDRRLRLNLPQVNDSLVRSALGYEDEHGKFYPPNPHAMKIFYDNVGIGKQNATQINVQFMNSVNAEVEKMSNDDLMEYIDKLQNPSIPVSFTVEEVSKDD